MSRASAEGALVLTGVLLLLAVPACGKKAPLRLPGDRPPETTATPRARVREGRVTLDFQVPRQRLFPEREEPWVLARILRQAPGAAAEAVEAGAILQTGGFAFGAPLAWSDREQPAGTYVYRVEFRDAVRRRRAVSGPVTVAWERLPTAPAGFTAAGGNRAIALSWVAPEGAGAETRYAVYRRASGEAEEHLVQEPLAQTRLLDSRVETGREYCYAVRSVLTVQSVAVEGAAAPEACARAAGDEPLPARPADAAP
jgi:predicted small lipoprotein YifL